MVTAETDPLARLVVDQTEANRELLARILEDKVRLDPAAKEFSFRHQVRARLGTKKTVLTALLTRKALHLLSADVPEAVTPRDLVVMTGIRGNTLRPVLKQLADRGIAVRRDGGYFIPNYALEDVARDLSVEA